MGIEYYSKDSMGIEQEGRGDRRGFLAVAGALVGAFAAGKLPSLSAQEQGIRPERERSQFDDLKDFVQTMGRVTVELRELDSKTQGATGEQRQRWGEIARSVKEVIGGAEDQVVAQLRKQYAAEGAGGEDFAKQLRERISALREAEEDLSIIVKRAAQSLPPGSENTAQRAPSPATTEKRSSSPLIVIANPFEDILARNGVYSLLGDLAKQGLDTFAAQTMKEGGISLKKDWKWRLETKRHTRPQDVEAERAYEVVRNGLVTLASIDALVKRVDSQPARAQDSEWQLAKKTAQARIADVETKLREGFESSLTRSGRANGMQIMNEASTRIGLTYRLVEAFLE
jgi:hypothetical protein